jgi:hypothetical protein
VQDQVGADVCGAEARKPPPGGGAAEIGGGGVHEARRNPHWKETPPAKAAFSCRRQQTDERMEASF